MQPKIIFTLAISLVFLFITNKTLAQGPITPSFSKIILYDIRADSTQNISVPANKIWKIESVSLGATGAVPGVLLKDSSNKYIAFFSSPASTASASYPFWLPASFTGAFVNKNPSYRCSISITEYTVSP